ncbi:MAG: hotdog domain-containing protein [Acidimicrobiales bacterium]|jgi:predicted thioesterase|nr:hotdog domain-containing protein [Acidimicrobiales bacterium]
MSVEAGLSGCIERQVTDDDTAIALGSGDVAVLATPRVLAWAEAACVVALDGHLEAGETTVGMRIQLDHLQPTDVGRTLSITAEVDLVEGRRLTLAVAASDHRGTIAAGRVVRVIVDRDRFLELAAE